MRVTTDSAKRRRTKRLLRVKSLTSRRLTLVRSSSSLTQYTRAKSHHYPLQNDIAVKGVEWTIQWRIMSTLTISRLLYFEPRSKKGSLLIGSFPVCRHQQLEIVDWPFIVAPLMPLFLEGTSQRVHNFTFLF